jgi:hypothetical protein
MDRRRHRSVAFVTLAASLALLGVDRVDVDTTHELTAFRPLEAMGSTVDKEPRGSIPSLYTPKHVRMMLGTGLGWLSYRLFTELSSQDWHWNPRGSFTQGDRGYWTSSAGLSAPLINDSYQYALPHRGSTTDQGNNASYSRIDDGDRSTYWKSNPYLGTRPQWVVVDFGRAKTIDTVKIDWAEPHATRYDFALWTGTDAINDPGHGSWRPFTNGSMIRARFIRIELTQSSKTCDSHGRTDWRNCTGYAIHELYAGRTTGGKFVDEIVHQRSQHQTPIYVSSVDPWHGASDKVRDQEQPGLDLIARSGLTRNIGAVYPVPMLYSTPENAVNEVRYLRSRGYKIRGIELGEEPDGQYVTPEDDADLFVRWARALHAYDPSLKLGGPVFSGANDDIQWWPDARGNISWLKRWLNYLREHNALNELAFMSFEHYPYEGCEHGAKLLKDLLGEPALIAHMAHVWRRDGLPPAIPMDVTEANFTYVNYSQAPMQIEGALWLADYFGSALSNGVRSVVYYQYEPVPISQNAQCPADWGNLTIFVADRAANVRALGAQYFASQMLTREWVAPGLDLHRLYRARSSSRYVSTYAVQRPGGQWSVLFVNKDSRPHQVAVRFGSQSFRGSVTRADFGPAQYVWHARAAASMPSPDGPPAHSVIPAASSYKIPAQSITVLRGSAG